MSGGRRRRRTMSGSAPPQQAEVDQMDHTHVLVTALRLCDTSLLYPPAIYLTVHRHVCAPASVYFHQLQKKLSVQPEVLRQGGDDLLHRPNPPSPPGQAPRSRADTDGKAHTAGTPDTRLPPSRGLAAEKFASTTFPPRTFWFRRSDTSCKIDFFILHQGSY